MSEEMEDGKFGAFEPEPSTSETDGAEASWLDEGEPRPRARERPGSVVRDRSGSTKCGTTFSQL